MSSQTRYFGRAKHIIDIPNLCETQRKFYAEFLQAETLPNERKRDGLQAIFLEVFPIKSYDEQIVLDFLEYDLGEPRHTPDECRALGLTYGAPLKIRCRLKREEVVEEEVYLGSVPLMIGGGEFIINGAERVIVTQVQRSPGADFSEDIHPSGKRLHSCRIIPERGSWIQVEVSSKDLLYLRIDRSGKIIGTTFLRALSEKFGTTRDILKAFYPVETISLGSKTERLKGTYLTQDIADPNSGEVIVPALTKLTEEIIDTVRGLKVKEVEVVTEAKDELIINSIREDDVDSHEEAMLRIYQRMRPGNPPQKEKAIELFNELFFDDKRYNFGRIGRFRLNRKFGRFIDGSAGLVPEDILTLTAMDYYNVLRYLMYLRSGGTRYAIAPAEGEHSAKAGAQFRDRLFANRIDAEKLCPEGCKVVEISYGADDIDHLENRRVRTIKDLVMDEFRKGMIKLRRSVRERMSLKDAGEMTPRTLINSQTVASSIEYFFARGELSQVVDQSNPLSQLTHERRLSALGPGGLNRKRAGFEVRDVHPSHYGRICPIETPEGTNIGLIVSLSIYASINDYGFIVTPFSVVKKGVITDEVLYLRADEEHDHTIANADVKYDTKTGKIQQDRVMARRRSEFVNVPLDEITLMDVSPKQLVGVAAALIPFLEHDDANRALMGSNMQRQAVPLVRPHQPLVGTGMEKYVAANSGMMLVAEEDGVVEYADGSRIEVRYGTGSTSRLVNEPLRKYFGLNERTCLNQTPIIRAGDKVTKGQVLTQGAATQAGELALGNNILVAFMSWEGYNFEDAILVNERQVRDDVFTSIHIEEFSVEIRETKLGREEITRDIPNVSEAALRNLDEEGLVRVGTRVKPGDILVGKIAPKSKSELSSEEKLLHAIFGRAGEDVKNDSLEVKPGCEGYVINVERFTRASPTGEEERGENRKLIKKIEGEYKQRIAEVIRQKLESLKEVVDGKLVNAETGQRYELAKGATDDEVIALDQALDLNKVEMHANTRRKARMEAYKHDKRKRVLEVELERKVGKLKRGDELQPGVLELVKVYVAVKRRLSVGDKMAGRHGNKGVVSCILPEEDMPFLEDGTPVSMILNPLGVPSRMNFGQILETHLGYAASRLGFKAITPVFDGAKEVEIVECMKEAGLNPDGKQQLYDGRTGEPFDQKSCVGVMYMLKLHHLVADKIHARATGPYSLITQQPLGGKARSGGQRFGEMEVWALQAYGAANILQELLTVKSDDVEGRTKIYESMVKGENILEPGTPVSFDVLCNEIKGLGLNIKLEKKLKAGQ
ncbi:MAG TPA: DNA-directed RNA polymerase subunit beta [Planctomycetota bacterium]|jgi:DNA-directed RNA polymerase subunit beta